MKVSDAVTTIEKVSATSKQEFVFFMIPPTGFRKKILKTIY
jgi:hypothetical protein